MKFLKLLAHKTSIFLVALVLSFAIFSGVVVVRGNWSGPLCAPPGCNLSPPLTQSSVYQEKLRDPASSAVDSGTVGAYDFFIATTTTWASRLSRGSGHYRAELARSDDFIPANASFCETSPAGKKTCSVPKRQGGVTSDLSTLYNRPPNETSHDSYYLGTVDPAVIERFCRDADGCRVVTSSFFPANTFGNGPYDLYNIGSLKQFFLNDLEAWAVGSIFETSRSGSNGDGGSPGDRSALPVIDFGFQVNIGPIPSGTCYFVDGDTPAPALSGQSYWFDSDLDEGFSLLLDFYHDDILMLNEGCALDLWD